MYLNIFDILLLIFCFVLPSIIIAKIVLVLTKMRLSNIQAFLVGEVIWLFIFLSGAIISGLSGWIIDYFKVVSIVALALSVISVGYMLRTAIKFVSNKKVPCLSLSTPIYISVLLLIVLGLVLILYHHIWSEFDAVTLYIPQAKSILITGSLTFNPYDYSTSMMMSSSGLYINYAYSLYLVPSIDAIRIIPVFYFMFGVLSVYLLAHELLSSKNAALVALSVFLSFIALLKTVAQFSLYTDLAFVFLLIFTTFTLTKWVKEETNFWLLISGITITLMLFFKPFGYIIAPTVVGLLLIFAKPSWCRYLGVFIAFLPLHLETFIFILRPWLTMSFSSTYAADVVNLLVRWSPAAVISILILLMLRKRVTPKILTAKGFLAFILPLAIFGLYITYYFLKFGLLLLPHQLLNPSMGNMISLYYQIIPTSQANMASYYSWYNLLLGGLAGAYLIPLFLGIYFAAKHLRARASGTLTYCLPSIFVVAALLVLWSYLGSGFEPRRLLLFGPFVAIIIVMGVLYTSRLLKIPKNLTLVSLCIFNALALGYFWSRVESIELINLRSFGLSNFELIDYCIFALLFIFVMLIPNLIHLALKESSGFIRRCSWRIHFLKPATFILIIGIVTQTIIVSGIASYYVSTRDFNNDFNSPQSIDHFYDLSGIDTKYLLGDFTDVISYFNNLPDSSAVLGFYIHYLTLFTNRSAVDLTWSYGYEKYGEILTLNQTAALKGLYENNITYVLVPNNKHPLQSVYQTYLKSQSILPFLNNISTSLITSLFNRNEYILTPVHHFMCYDLYAIKKSADSSVIYPLSFDAAGYVTVSQSTSLNTLQNFTIEALVYLNALPSQTKQHFEICGKEWNSMRLFVSSENDKLTFVQSYDGATLTYRSNIALKSNQWYCIAVTYDSSSLKIYIDTTSNTDVARTGLLGTNDSPLILHGFRSDGVNGTTGLMADFRIYKQALTADQIMWNLGNMMSPINNNLVLWFKFTEGNGTVLSDSSGSNSYGLIHGASWLNNDR